MNVPGFPSVTAGGETAVIELLVLRVFDGRGGNPWAGRPQPYQGLG